MWGEVKVGLDRWCREVFKGEGNVSGVAKAEYTGHKKVGVECDS